MFFVFFSVIVIFSTVVDAFPFTIKLLSIAFFIDCSFFSSKLFISLSYINWYFGLKFCFGINLNGISNLELFSDINSFVKKSFFVKNGFEVSLFLCDKKVLFFIIFFLFKSSIWYNFEFFINSVLFLSLLTVYSIAEFISG